MTNPKTPKTKRPKKSKTTQKTAVVHEFIDSQESINENNIEVIADNVDIANKEVSDVAVIKVTHENVTSHNTNNNENDVTKSNTKTAQEIAKETAQSKLDELAKQLGEAEQQAEQKIAHSVEQAQESFADTKEAINEALNDVGEKTAQVIDKLHENIEQKFTSSTEHDHKTDDEQNFANANSIKKTQTVKGLGRLLAKAGTYLAINNKQYQGVELASVSDAKARHAFDVQGVSLGGQFAKAILGQGKASTAQSLVGRFIGDDKLTAISESVYEKMADMAQAWAFKSLPTNPNVLTMSEKDELANIITSQSRTLAVMGGGSGFLGLVGVVVDTAWLLLIALRTIYQLALIYEKPLTGKDGINMAYGVLAGANLTKMQEKQVILMALALANSVLSRVGEGSLKDELIQLSSSNSTLKDFDDLLKLTHLDKFADKYGVDIDKLNANWLRHLTSLVAVGVGTHYNRILIDEIIGTAMATFREEQISRIEYQH